MPDCHVSRVLDGKIAYWKFRPAATVETFQEAFEEFNEMIHRPEITRLVVNVQMKNAWSRGIQALWLQTGAIADQAGIEKWGVVTPTPQKEATIRFLVKGGREGNRQYRHFISTSEAEVLAWAGRDE